MARYIQDITLNKPEDFVSYMMNDYLQKNSFTLADWKGTPAYKRGDGFFEAVRYITWHYSGGVLHLEAWMRGGFGKEMGLTGFYGWGAKAAFKKELEKLIELLHQDIPADSFADGAAPGAIPIKTMDNKGAATAALVLGILSICTCLIPLVSVIIGCLSVMFSRSGGGSKASLAKAGKVCAIVGMCLALAIYVITVMLEMTDILM